MIEKVCTKCNILKILICFYKKKDTPDKFTNKCKMCILEEMRNRAIELKKNPEWVLKERSRSREKKKRLNYNLKYKQTSEEMKISKQKYFEKYPEKRIIKNKLFTLITEKGYNNHHWSYNLEHALDTIKLSEDIHHKIHQYLIYDTEFLMYRTRNNELLNTKEKHLNYILQYV